MLAPDGKTVLSKISGDERCSTTNSSLLSSLVRPLHYRTMKLSTPLINRREGWKTGIEIELWTSNSSIRHIQNWKTIHFLPIKSISLIVYLLKLIIHFTLHIYQLKGKVLTNNKSQSSLFFPSDLPTWVVGFSSSCSRFKSFFYKCSFDWVLPLEELMLLVEERIRTNILLHWDLGDLISRWWSYC